MTQSYDLVLKGATVVNHDGEAVRDLAIAGGRIAAIGDLSWATAGEIIDCRGLTVLPGVIDTQVHFRDPGMTHKEDLVSGSLSAVMGGVTAVFEMPNTNPPTTSAEALAAKVARARHRMHCDFAFFVGGTRENTKELPDLERLPGCAGVKVFMGSSTGSLLVEDDEEVRRLGSEVLQVCGYTVVETGDPLEALTIGERRNGAIDLLVTDMVMPGMGGAELATRLEAMSPGLRVLCMSGYADQIAAVTADHPARACLPKPFTPHDLAKKVREALTGASP